VSSYGAPKNVTATT